MNEHDIWQTFSALLQERMEEAFDDEPEEALDWLGGCLGSFERADALLSGRANRLSSSETAAICRVLELDADIVSALLTEASNEVLLHVTGMTLAGCPVVEPDSCPVCVSLHERHERARSADPRADLQALALDVVGHIHSIERFATSPPAAGLSPTEREIFTLLGELPHAARLRVLAAAHEERERSRPEPTPEPVVLRMFDALPSGCRALVGYLVRRPGGIAFQSEVSRDLDLDGGALQDLEVAFDAACRNFQPDAGDDGEPAVRKFTDQAGTRYQVSPVLLAALQARRSG